MRLLYNGVRFELICTPSEKDQPKSLGFHYDYRQKKWWTARPDLAKKFEQYADPLAHERLNRDSTQVSLSRAIDSSIEIPSPDGLTYLPFQKAGVHYAISRKNTLLADEMGLGKSIQTCGVINVIPEIKKVLIIPPASLRINWRKELKKWLVREFEGAFATEKGFPSDADIVIINYDIVKKYRSEIDKLRWDLVVMDESHYLKTPTSRRTVAVLGSETEGKRVIPPIDAGMRLFLTGTPLLNRPVELWPTVRVADPEGLGSSRFSFLRRYCAAWNAPWGWDVSGHSNLEELQDRLRASIMIRRLKKDVLTELPAKRRQIVALPCEGAKTEVKNEIEFYEKNQKIIEDARHLAEESQVDGSNETYKQALDILKKTKQVLFEQMSILRRQTASKKIPFASSYIQDLLEGDGKIVVFAHHREVIEALKNKFSSICTYMHGDVCMEDRQKAVDRFQEDETCRMIVGSIGTMGVGWTLTASSYCLFVELDWVPALISQAEDRLHRIGQLESVLIQHLVFDNSLDATMAERIIKKQEVIDSALG